MDTLIWLRAQWDRVAGYTCIGLGVLCLALGYRGVSHSPYVADELSYLVSGALTGLFLLGVGATLLLSADLHDEWRKLDRVEAAILALATQASTTGVTADDNGDCGNNGGVALPKNLSDRLRTVTSGDPHGQARQVVGALIVGMLTAGVVLAASWHRVASNPDPHTGLGGTATAASAVILAGFCAGMYVLSLKRRLRDTRSRLLSPFVVAQAAAGPPLLDSPGSERGTVASARSLDAVDEFAGKVAVADGLSYYHRAGCAAIARLDVSWLPSRDAEVGLRPCPLCHT